ncbi:MAG: ATP-binding cassette subfamily B multidrug efflux pump [Cellvibrionaceae bacterium]|jgi:ATP-binding cassette subfamily B multidrug efflux pump
MTAIYDSAASQWRKRREQRINDLLPEEEDDLTKVDPKLLFRLGIFLEPYRTQVIWAVVFMIISAVVGVAQPWIIGKVFDEGIDKGSVPDLRYWVIIFAVSALIELVANKYRISIMGIVGGHVVADVRARLYNHLHSLSLTFHNNYSVGRMMSRLLGDITMLRDFITWSVTGLFRSVFSLFGIIVVMLYINWRLALISFIVLPVLVIATNYYRVNIRLSYRAARSRSSLISGYFNESISGIRVTKSFTREEENFGFFDLLNSDLKRINFQAAFLTAIFFPCVEIVGALSVGLVVVFGGIFILGDSATLTAGELIAFILYVQRFFEPIRELAQRFNVFQGTMASTERIFGLLDTEPDLVDAPDAYAMPAIDGKVRFENVEFSYKGSERILKGISLEAKPGEQIALVGETGAGKSTVIRLLARFYDVSEGQVTIDGHDIRNVTVESLRQQMGVVLQDTFMFSGTVLDNIRYGRLEATDDEVIAAATAVGAHEFVLRMPNGFQTEVGQDGVNLSVGQKQILSFARALLADPRILVLDEATSSVDTTTEKQIQSALETLLSGRTSFVIAHRLNTIVNSDRIIVLDQGEIVERGTHDELLAQKGRYYNLYTMQWSDDE